MNRIRSIARLAFAATVAVASPSAHALLPSVEWNCCQSPAFGAERPECKPFARSAERCQVVTREFLETARAFEAAQKRAAARPPVGLRDSSGAPVQSGSGDDWLLPSMVP